MHSDKCVDETPHKMYIAITSESFLIPFPSWCPPLSLGGNHLVSLFISFASSRISKKWNHIRRYFYIRFISLSVVRFISLVASCFSCSFFWLFATPLTVAHQAPLSMGFSRWEYWSGFHLLLQGIFPTHRLNPHLLYWQVGSLPLNHLGRLLLHASVVYSFLLLRNTLAYMCISSVAQSCPTLCDPMNHILLLVVTWTLSRFWWSCIKLLSPFMCRSPCRHTLSFFLVEYLGVELLGHRIVYV